METLSIDAVAGEAVEKVRRQLFAKGARGLGPLARILKAADLNGNGKLDRDEFEEALAFAGIFLTKAETSAVFRKFDVSADGHITIDEFLRGVKGDTLSKRRLGMINKAFESLDADGSGVLTVDDLRGKFNASKHPEFLAGRMTEDQILLEFLESFEGRLADGDGRVTTTEFEEYYQDVSASIPSDDYFVAMMESVWMITETESSAALKAEIEAWADVVRQKIREKTHTGHSESVKLRQYFQHVDTDESGAVTLNEFNAAMLRLGIPLERKDTSAFFKFFDADLDARLTYAEFCDFVMSR